MTPPKGAVEILHERNALDFVVQSLSDRASSHAATGSRRVRGTPPGRPRPRQGLVRHLEPIAHDYQDKGTALQYNPAEVGAAKPLLHDFLDPELKTMHPRHKEFRANRSMRDVEPSVNLWLRTMDNIDIEAGGACHEFLQGQEQETRTGRSARARW